LTFSCWSDVEREAIDRKKERAVQPLLISVLMDYLKAALNGSSVRKYPLSPDDTGLKA